MIGTMLVDKKDEEITAQVIDEYRFFYVVEVNAKGGKYRESLFKQDWKTMESRWRLR